MGIQIKGQAFPLSKIFSTDFEYVIPSYQRPYAWTEHEAGILFQNLLEAFRANKDGEYFLGSIVLIKTEEQRKAEVIDGQQRLLTLTLLLAALADGSPEPDKQAILNQYIIQPPNKFEGIIAKPFLEIRKKDNDFLSRYIHQLDFAGLSVINEDNLPTEAQINIKNNAMFFRNAIHSLDKNEINLDDFIRFIISNCTIVTVTTPTQNDAMRIFSVMNTTGKDLQTTDILKADMLQHIPDTRKQDSYSEKWEDIEQDIGRDLFDDLFSYIRMIKLRDKAKVSIVDDFRNRIMKNDFDAIKFIDEELDDYSKYLRMIKNTNYMAKSEDESDRINFLLRCLNRIDDTDWIPPAIEFLKYFDDNISATCKFFENLERLAAFMHISGFNVNDRISRYAQLLGSKTKNDYIDAAALTSAEKGKMKSVLDGEIYTMSPRRRNYVILRLDSIIGSGATYDYKVLTIEHVLPQTIKKGSSWEKWWPVESERAFWLHRLANLVPLPRKRNSAAQNMDFDEKKKKYFLSKKGVSSYALTTQVLNEKIWNKSILEKRQKDLLQNFCNEWDL